MSKNLRSEELIADFTDGFAKNWHFVVGECFKKELDIELSTRQKQKKAYKVWTQGPYFSFSEGNIFYDSLDAFKLQWGDALKTINKACQVIKASPSKPSETEIPEEGFVEFRLFVNDRATNQLKLDKKLKTTQTQFVEYLKNGVLPKDIIEL